VVLLTLAWEARMALLAIYVSLLIAAGFSRPVTALEHVSARGRHLPRWAAALMVYVAALGVIVLVGWVAATPLVSQVQQFWATLPGYLDRLQGALHRAGIMTRRVTFADAVTNTQDGDPAASLRTVVTVGSSAIGGLVGAVSVLVLSFYFLVEGQSIGQYLLRFLPAGRRSLARDAGRTIVLKVSHWLEGTAIISGVMGVATALLLAALRVPFPYVVALVAALGESVPMVGPLCAGALAILIALTVSGKLAVVVGMCFVVLHEIEANVLVPKIMAQRVGISAAAVTCGLLIGWEVAGVAGAVLAIPTVAIVSVAIEQFASPNRGRTPALL
jgi:predicted PurR-regulated permease PerM